MTTARTPWPLELRPLDASSYRAHPLHGEDRAWSETNCYTDVWIELLHGLGTEPLASAAFTVAADFEGSQWAFFKPPLEDLRFVHGVEVGEMNVWQPVLDHVVEELGLGRLLTVEVDSWFLPDTAGTAYGREHVKTTIAAQAVDVVGRRLGYFHGSGYHELSGDDFDGIFARPVLPPYVELVRLPSSWPDVGELVGRSTALLEAHLDRLPVTNPVDRMRAAIERELPRLGGADPERYHLFAFGTLRQCGASAAVAAAYLQWLGEGLGADLAPAVESFTAVADGAKAAQFLLARAARGRSIDPGPPLDAMARSWAAGTSWLMDEGWRRVSTGDDGATG